MIAIVDYDAGNLRSVVRAAEHGGAEVTLTADPDVICSADGVIFPGVGAAGDAMDALRDRGLVDPLREVVARGRPFLGVCLGLQLLLEISEEAGRHECLGVFPGVVRAIPPGLKVPHMGWNSVHFESEHPVIAGIPNDSYFYFVHSFYGDVTDPSCVLGMTEYGSLRFASVLARGNVVATQFHPEKSSTNGLKIYANFARWVAEGGK